MTLAEFQILLLMGKTSASTQGKDQKQKWLLLKDKTVNRNNCQCQ